MKQLLLIGGLSLVSMTSFSQQQISNEKKPNSAQVPAEMLQEPVLDSTSVNSMKKQINPISPAEPKENQGSNGQEKPVLNSTKRKPE